MTLVHSTSVMVPYVEASRDELVGSTNTSLVWLQTERFRAEIWQAFYLMETSLVRASGGMGFYFGNWRKIWS